MESSPDLHKLFEVVDTVTNPAFFALHSGEESTTMPRCIHAAHCWRPTFRSNVAGFAFFVVVRKRPEPKESASVITVERGRDCGMHYKYFRITEDT